jgi:serine phosphatase RsbU (regulator of sigma subunit)
MFGKERLQGLVQEFADLPAGEVYDAIAKAHREFTGAAPQLDDITLVVIKAV